MENTPKTNKPSVSPSVYDCVPLDVAARRLRVPKTWLRAEIEADRLSGLIAGRAILVHVPTVARQLADLAKGGAA